MPVQSLKGALIPQLTRLYYVSKATSVGVDEIFNSIIPVARAFNSQHAITGLLTFDGSYFTQALEGPLTEVDQLIRKITADKRHSGLKVLMKEPVYTRKFGNWSMGYIYDVKLIDDVSALALQTHPATEDVEAFLDDLQKKVRSS